MWIFFWLVFLISPALADQTKCVTVSDAKALKINTARQAYNDRTGQSLTVEQWLYLIIRREVVAENARIRELDAQTAIEDAKRAYEQVVIDEEIAVQQTREAENQGW